MARSLWPGLFWAIYYRSKITVLVAKRTTLWWLRLIGLLLVYLFFAGQNAILREQISKGVVDISKAMQPGSAESSFQSYSLGLIIISFYQLSWGYELFFHERKYRMKSLLTHMGVGHLEYHLGTIVPSLILGFTLNLLFGLTGTDINVFGLFIACLSSSLGLHIMAMFCSTKWFAGILVALYVALAGSLFSYVKLGRHSVRLFSLLPITGIFSLAATSATTTSHVYDTLYVIGYGAISCIIQLGFIMLKEKYFPNEYGEKHGSKTDTETIQVSDNASGDKLLSGYVSRSELFRVNGVSKNFGSTEVLTDINLDIPKGGNYCFLGNDKSGKSVLLHLLVGDMNPSKGQVYTAKDTVISFCPQEEVFWQRLTVREHLEYVKNITALSNTESLNPKSEEQNLFSDVVRLLGLQPVLESRAERLKNGLTKKMNIGMAILARPDAIILDSPSAAIDPLLRQSSMANIISLCTQHNITLIFSTANSQEAENYAEEITCLKDGKVCLQGPLTKIRELDRRVTVTVLRVPAQGLQLMQNILPQLEGSEWKYLDDNSAEIVVNNDPDTDSLLDFVRILENELNLKVTMKRHGLEEVITATTTMQVKDTRNFFDEESYKVWHRIFKQGDREPGFANQFVAANRLGRYGVNNQV